MRNLPGSMGDGACFGRASPLEVKGAVVGLYIVQMPDVMLPAWRRAKKLKRDKSRNPDSPALSQLQHWMPVGIQCWHSVLATVTIKDRSIFRNKVPADSQQGNDPRIP
jgi:hypothetical protein